MLYYRLLFLSGNSLENFTFWTLKTANRILVSQQQARGCGQEAPTTQHNIYVIVLIVFLWMKMNMYKGSH